MHNCPHRVSCTMLFLLCGTGTQCLFTWPFRLTRNSSPPFSNKACGPKHRHGWFHLRRGNQKTPKVSCSRPQGPCQATQSKAPGDQVLNTHACCPARNTGAPSVAQLPVVNEGAQCQRQFFLRPRPAAASPDDQESNDKNTCLSELQSRSSQPHTTQRRRFPCLHPRHHNFLLQPVLRDDHARSKSHA